MFVFFIGAGNEASAVAQTSNTVRIANTTNEQKLYNNDIPRLREREKRILERLVMAEAGGEPFMGQVAVANVVFNRMRSSQFPDTLYEVVFQDGQFTPAMLGILPRTVPTESVRRAVSAALRGKQAVSERVLFFLNPRTATSRWIIRNRNFSERIGNHDFYK